MTINHGCSLGERVSRVAAKALEDLVLAITFATAASISKLTPSANRSIKMRGLEHSAMPTRVGSANV